LRIIAGEARGRVLAAPKGLKTRPTQDRVRESLFSILMPRIPGARVLDLFAGSGALGLEALSRGAAHATFVDHSRAAQAAVRRNIEAVGVSGRAALLPCDWREALRRLRPEGARFTLVFLDPPYRMPGAEALPGALRDSGVVSDETLVVFEHARDFTPGTAGWRVRDMRVYGDTVITFLG